VICADAIRGELGDDADQSRTPRAFKPAFERVRHGLDAGQSVTWGATNISRSPDSKRPKPFLEHAPGGAILHVARH
jgi:hypothetical protein